MKSSESVHFHSFCFGPWLKSQVSLRSVVVACTIIDWSLYTFGNCQRQQFLSGKGHFKENVNLYRNFAKGTTAKHRAQWQVLWVLWIVLRPGKAFIDFSDMSPILASAMKTCLLLVSGKVSKTMVKQPLSAMGQQNNGPFLGLVSTINHTLTLY